MTVCVQELDGFSYHVVQVNDSSRCKVSIPIHSKSRKLTYIPFFEFLPELFILHIIIKLTYIVFNNCCINFCINLQIHTANTYCSYFCLHESLFKLYRNCKFIKVMLICMFRIKRKRVTLINGDEVEMDLSSIEYEFSNYRILIFSL